MSSNLATSTQEHCYPSGLVSLHSEKFPAIDQYIIHTSLTLNPGYFDYIAEMHNWHYLNHSSAELNKPYLRSEPHALSSRNKVDAWVWIDDMQSERLSDCMTCIKFQQLDCELEAVGLEASSRYTATIVWISKSGDF